MRSGAKVAVGLSGGVDSSIAATLLMEQGHRVLGLFMSIYDEALKLPLNNTDCCFGPGERRHLEAASKICRELGIPFYTIDLKKEYKQYVLDYFTREYLCGRTPNPCIICNRFIKFGFLIKKALQHGIEFDYFATGHYARIQKKGERFLLKRSLNRSKDQSYFLYMLTQEQLSHILFPIGDFTKEDIRHMAARRGLSCAERPESQDFLSRGNYAVLFKGNQIRPGEIISKDGHILGTHKGIIHYTIGQRRGLGISSPRPLYVIQIDPRENRLIVGDKDDLLCKGLIASDINLISTSRIDHQMKVTAKIRLKHEEAEATLQPIDENKVKIIFDTPQLAVTPGQSVVFYQGDIVVGGGIIERAIPVIESPFKIT